MVNLGEKKLVMILEDSPTQAVELEFILSEGGYLSVSFENGKKALEYLLDDSNQKPHIIVSDIVMPEMNGYEFCSQIKADNRLKKIPVMLLTSLSSPGDVISGLECGADNFITKPYKAEYLLSRINYILVNQYMREANSTDLGVSIQFGKRKYFITSDRVQILDLLFSSLEDSVQKNNELKATIQELKETRKKLLIANKNAEDSKKELNRLANHDVLTGLYNRRAFEIMSEKLISMSNRNNHRVGVFHIDVDNFKSINDTLGHGVGDKILKVTAKRLVEVLRKEDIVGRIGGDEFAVLVMEVEGKEGIFSIAEKMLKAFEKPVKVLENNVFATISIGATLSEIGGQDNSFQKLLKEADIAMYEAKDKGKFLFKLFSKKLQSKYEVQQSMEEELRSAIRNKEFSMVYQPIVRFDDKKVIGVESLIRWSSPKLGSVGPDEFIRLAERTKQIHLIGEWVIDEVLKQHADMMKDGIDDFLVTINISPIQFERKDFIPYLIRTMEKYNINCKNIVIEITETAFSQFLKAEYLLRMREQKMQIAIDDFGSGYSSMQRLLELPVDFIKIDGDTITKLFTHNKYQVIVENILNIAKSLNIKAIAESVETAEQAEFLVNNGCEFMQGFYYHKPLVLSKLKGLMKN